MPLLAPASRDAHEHEHEAHFSGILLPDQLGRRDDPETRSARLLMTAIVRDAIDCFQKCLFDGSRRGRRLYREAEEWLMAENRSSPLAFEEICDGLGVDAESVRRHLSAWRELELARATALPPATWRAGRSSRRHPSPAVRPGSDRRPARG